MNHNVMLLVKLMIIVCVIFLKGTFFTGFLQRFKCRAEKTVWVLSVEYPNVIGSDCNLLIF